MRDLVRQPVDRDHHRQPAVGDLGGHLDRPGVERGQVDRHLFAVGVEAQGEATLELEDVAVVVEPLTGEEDLHDLDGLAHALEGGLEGHAVEVLDHQRSAVAEADDHAALGQFVDRGEMLGERGGGAGVDVDDARADLHALGPLGELDQGGEGVLAPGFGHPERVDPDLVGDLCALECGLTVHRALPVESHANASRHLLVSFFCFGVRGKAYRAFPT